MFLRRTLNVVSLNLKNHTTSSSINLNNVRNKLNSINNLQQKSTITNKQQKQLMILSTNQIRCFSTNETSNDDQAERRSRRARENLDAHNAKALEAFFEPLDDKGRIRHSGE